MIKMFGTLSLLFINLFASSLTIASYNVQNLFDLKYDKTEYIEYIPNNKYNWNKTTFKTKLSNISRVIKDLNPTIIALQEIESLHVLKKLQNTLPKYKYKAFVKYKNSAAGIAILSKIEIVENKKIDVYFFNKLFRPIQEITFKYNNINFKIFNNHWSSKKFDEKYRIKYAYTLFERLKKVPKDYDYIIVGDLNSNYNENETFINKNLNTTSNITGINHILNTTLKDSFIYKNKILNSNKKIHFNLWLDIPYKKRFSYKFRGKNQTPDNIILPYSLFDNKKLSYVNNSYRVFRPKYLYANKRINRWKIRNKIHQNEGFSDHLPIYAKFEISKYKKEIDNIKVNKIKQLYKMEYLKNPILLKKCVVIFNNRDFAIVKQENSKAIYIYKKEHNLKLGFSYDLIVNNIKRYNGLKEITNFTIKETGKKEQNIDDLYIKKIDDFNNLKYQNEIVSNIKGFYKKNYFYYDKYKIRIYFKDKKLKPTRDKELLIKKAHIGFYNSKAQFVIYTKEDFK